MHDIPRVKNSKKLPSVLSFSEITSILDATTNLKHKAILMTAYSAGLRVSEVPALKVSDIHSENMQIHVRSGKGDKDPSNFFCHAFTYQRYRFVYHQNLVRSFKY